MRCDLGAALVTIAVLICAVPTGAVRYGINTTRASATMRLWSTAGGAARTTTTVALTGSAVDGLSFNAHLHSQPCSQDGGGHYQNDPSGAVDAANENWLTISCIGTVCTSEATSLWQPTAAVIATGLSIVIHDTPSATSGSGAKYMCADLAFSASSGSPIIGSGEGPAYDRFTHHFAAFGAMDLVANAEDYAEDCVVNVHDLRTGVTTSYYGHNGLIQAFTPLYDLDQSLGLAAPLIRVDEPMHGAHAAVFLQLTWPGVADMWTDTFLAGPDGRYHTQNVVYDSILGGGLALTPSPTPSPTRCPESRWRPVPARTVNRGCCRFGQDGDQPWSSPASRTMFSQKSRMRNMQACKMQCMLHNTNRHQARDRSIPTCDAIEFDRRNRVCELHTGTPTSTSIDSTTCRNSRCRVAPGPCTPA